MKLMYVSFKMASKHDIKMWLLSILILLSNHCKEAVYKRS